jgi:CheY-like chemotaxis protein
MGSSYFVADDSMFARMLIKDAIKQIDADASFDEGASGADTIAHQEANDSKSDWFLLDINMGAPNGVDTAKALIDLGVDKDKIALVTGNKAEHLQAEAREIGVCYINKAISPTDVDGFIERLTTFFNNGA